ncbi:hypothetical protein CASFOL_039369 [Castilleja foliolosa]|uniref:Uncharacterized protein n=1 Tax=Castilleja foliolosa TaxID=1961234 RepID=A0ABD3BJS4_9LAMI
MGRRWLWLLKGSTAASGRNTVANRLTVSNVVVGLVAEKDGGFGSSKRLVVGRRWKIRRQPGLRGGGEQAIGFRRWLRSQSVMAVFVLASAKIGRRVIDLDDDSEPGWEPGERFPACALVDVLELG